MPLLECCAIRYFMNEEPDLAIIEEERRVRRQTDVRYILKCLGVIILLVLIAAVFTPVVLKSPKKPNMTQAVSNSKQIYLALLDFESDYGTFPDEKTAKKATKLSDFHGAYSNDYLGQLIAGGYTTSEQIFYAYRKRSSKKPDDDISPPSNILEKGECGFAYTMVKDAGSIRGLSTGDNGGIPVLSAIMSDDKGSFDPTAYDHRGVYLRVDGSARQERIQVSDNKVYISGGKTLFETGNQTVWGNLYKLEPIILLPEH